MSECRARRGHLPARLALTRRTLEDPIHGQCGTHARAAAAARARHRAGLGRNAGRGMKRSNVARPWLAEQPASHVLLELEYLP
jgi:hypothetical protein